MPPILIRDGVVWSISGWLDPGYVVVDGDFIKTVAAGAPPSDLVATHTVISAQHSAVLPGLLNAHTHFSQVFMRGLGGGRPLLPWLKEAIWPLQRALSPGDMRLAATLGLVENLRCGVTEVIDNHKATATAAHTDAVCEAAAEVGLRFTLARGWADRGAGVESPGAILADLERLFDRWAGHPRVRIANGPIALWRCTGETLRRTHDLARRRGAFTHCHTAETQDEVRMSLDAYGLHPIAWLDHLGVLDTATQVVHAVWAGDHDVATLAKRRAAVVHCPVSNAVLGSGIAPVSAMAQAGVRVLLGTDGPASNDTQDLFETVKAALSLARVSTLDPTVLSPEQVLAWATGGRRLQAGAPGDCIVVNLDHVRAQPVHDPASALVLSTHGSDVTAVIVGGEVLMRAGDVLAVDEAALLEAGRSAAAVLKTRV